MRISLTLAACLCLSLSSIAQVSRTLHQTFKSDEITSIEVSLGQEVKIIPSKSNRIIIESNISLTNASPDILEYFIKNNRYEIMLDNQGGGAKIYPKNPTSSFSKFEKMTTGGDVSKTTNDANGNPIELKGTLNECKEIITYTVYMPEQLISVLTNSDMTASSPSE